MIVCEFCLHYSPAGTCRIDLKIPKGMSCREFSPVLQKFCADPRDFASARQIIEMATYFGLQKTELKKVIKMTDRKSQEDLKIRSEALLQGQTNL
jgi:hypothetical protein